MSVIHEDPGELNIYLVRHGLTEGNVDRSKYLEIPDHAIMLTERGYEQAAAAGAFLADLFRTQCNEDPEKFGQARIWHSPYYRTRLTAGEIIYEIGQKFVEDRHRISYREAMFLFEQKAGLHDGLDDDGYAVHHPKEAKHSKKMKKFLGDAYGEPLLGESRMDVALRAKPFFGTIIKDYRHRRAEGNHSGPIRNVVIVCHGVTLRSIVMAWMHYPPEWLDAERNPKQCWIRHLHGSGKIGYKDEGYIFGENAPLRDPMATQRIVESERPIIMLKPQRPNIIVPPGIQTIDPFTQRYRP